MDDHGRGEDPIHRCAAPIREKGLRDNTEMYLKVTGLDIIWTALL
jgi:hypothetical protein